MSRDCECGGSAMALAPQQLFAWRRPPVCRWGVARVLVCKYADHLSLFATPDRA